MIAGAFRQVLAELDVKAARRLWLGFLGQSDNDVLAALHLARTQAASIEFSLRAWSHAWLLDHGIPSALPDELRPRAERLYPRRIGAVGLVVVDRDPQRALHVRGAMEGAVLDAYGQDKEPKDEQVKRGIIAARDRALRD